jgi:hypothetical protein
VEEEADAPKKMRTGECLSLIISYSINPLCAGAQQRTWTVDGAIQDLLAGHYYCLDPAEQCQTKILTDAVMRGEFLTLSGARASGKTTRLFRLRELLEDEDYYCL